MTQKIIESLVAERQKLTANTHIKLQEGMKIILKLC